ncbi:MAG: SUMF1/EgtB/PvdO family nonheme iron enzyme [Anditalea sp.]
MITHKLLFLLILIVGIVPIAEKTSTSPNEFEPYRQKIPNTSLSFDMAPIPSGEFMMGSSAQNQGTQPDESPRHKVVLDAFWMGTQEISWDIFELFLDKHHEAAISEKPLPAEVDGLTRPSTPYLDMTFGMGKENKPAVAMTQYGAIQFCKWLYTKTDIFYRLPTEAEWEYAARAGENTTYFFGDNPDELDQYAWYAKNSSDVTHEIGQKKPNPWGLYDILGNVMEWTYDKYLPQYQVTDPEKPIENPVVKAEDLYPRVLRGGHYKSGAEDLRSARRFASTPVWKQLDPQIPKSRWWFPEAPFLGLRVVRPQVSPPVEEIMAYYDQTPIEDY